MGAAIDPTRLAEEPAYFEKMSKYTCGRHKKVKSTNSSRICSIANQVFQVLKFVVLAPFNTMSCAVEISEKVTLKILELLFSKLGDVLYGSAFAR